MSSLIAPVAAAGRLGGLRFLAEGAVGGGEKGSGGEEAGKVEAAKEESSADPLREPCSQAAPTPDGDRGP